MESVTSASPRSPWAMPLGSQGMVCLGLHKCPLQTPYSTPATRGIVEGAELFSLPSWRSKGRQQIFSSRMSAVGAQGISSSAKCSPMLWQPSSQHLTPAFPEQVWYRHSQTKRLFNQAIYWCFCRGQSSRSEWTLPRRPGGHCPAGKRSVCFQPPCSGLFSCMGCASPRGGFAVERTWRSNARC